MGKERNREEAARNQKYKVHRVKSGLKRFFPASVAYLLEMREIGGTHEKIVVCNTQFAINRSFNWLSSIGDQDEGYCNEMGMLLRTPDQVVALAAKALQTFLS